jgi:GntR family transcriptional regulator
MNAHLPLTKYHQVYLVLRQQLEEGCYEHGLPPELELTEEFKVSRVTVRRALAQLAQEGMIVREAGRGTRPTARLDSDERVPGGPPHATSAHRLPGLLENIVDFSGGNTIEVIAWEIVEASPSLARTLSLAIGTRLRKVVRRRSAATGPISHTTSYLPEGLVTSITRAKVARKPMLRLLKEAGIQVGRAEQTISAKQADTEIAAHLEVAIGSALLSVRRLVFDSEDRPVQLFNGLYRPDRYQYQMALSRAGSIEARIVATGVLP